LPYVLKFLWAPAVDFIGSRRHWIAAAQFIMAVLLIILMPLDPSNPGILLWTTLFALVVCSATQDVAIDAYTIEMLKTSEMGIANGFRQAAYRTAMMFSGGLFVAIGGHMGWGFTYIVAAAILLLCSVISLQLPNIEVSRPNFSVVDQFDFSGATRAFLSLMDIKRLPWILCAVAANLGFGLLLIGPMKQSVLTLAISIVAEFVGIFFFILIRRLAPVKDLVSRPGLVQVVLFILLYKLGDMALGPMVRPFWLDKGLSTNEIGLITGTFGVIAGMLGGLTGGLFMVRFGIFHGLWILGLMQAVSNLSYAWVAAFPTGNWAVYTASFIESFCGGLGTSAFLAFLMSICNKEFSATQYALLSAIFRITGILAGMLSGKATTHYGYAAYFAFTFFLSLPVFIFLPWAKRWIPKNGDSAEAEDNPITQAKLATD
jgi:MFS transporter, PAT family, beta-lactamase induction signal transducer AmpG